MTYPHEALTFMAPVARDITVGELLAALADIPEHYSVAPCVDGVIGVFQGVLIKTTRNDGPIVVIGEIHTGNVESGVLER